MHPSLEKHWREVEPSCLVDLDGGAHAVVDRLCCGLDRPQELPVGSLITSAGGREHEEELREEKQRADSEQDGEGAHNVDLALVPLLIEARSLRRAQQEPGHNDEVVWGNENHGDGVEADGQVDTQDLGQFKLRRTSDDAADQSRNERNQHASRETVLPIRVEQSLFVLLARSCWLLLLCHVRLSIGIRMHEATPSG